MKISVEELFNSSSTGAGSTFQLGMKGPGTSSDGIANPVVQIQVTGISNTLTVLKIQGSLDNSTYVDWISSITANGMYIIPEPVIFLRGNVSANTASDTVVVKIQQYLEG